MSSRRSWCVAELIVARFLRPAGCRPCGRPSAKQLRRRSKITNCRCQKKEKKRRSPPAPPPASFTTTTTTTTTKKKQQQQQQQQQQQLGSVGHGNGRSSMSNWLRAKRDLYFEKTR